jgi:hypothetical protein
MIKRKLQSGGLYRRLKETWAMLGNWISKEPEEMALRCVLLLYFILFFILFDKHIDAA